MKMIQTIDLTKRFGDFTANDHINLSVEKQEIKCIVGENGAGKSTLMNMLYGLLEPTEGKILIGGKEVKLKSPIDAIANGIGMVHQHFKLVPSLTVYENVMLGIEEKKNGILIDKKKEIGKVRELIKAYNFELDPMDKYRRYFCRKQTACRDFEDALQKCRHSDSGRADCSSDSAGSR